MIKGEPTHDANLQPLSAFMDKNGTINVSSLEYIWKNYVLPMFKKCLENWQNFIDTEVNSRMLENV